VILSDLKWIEGHILGLISQAVLQLTYTGKNSSTVGLQLTIFPTHSKLYGEPVNGGKARKFALISAKTCETYLLAEICEILVCEHGGMTEELVDDVWFGGVKWHAVVADVLGRVEHLEGEAVQELALSQKATHGLKAPAGLGLKKFRDGIQLWYLILSEADVLLKLLNGPLELLARISLEQVLQL